MDLQQPLHTLQHKRTMPLDSKWASAEPTEEASSPKKQVRSSKKPSTHHTDSKKKLSSKKQNPAQLAVTDSDTDDNSTDSDWSRPSSGRKSAIFDNERPKSNHSSKTLADNPLAKALGISCDPPQQGHPNKNSHSKGHSQSKLPLKKADKPLPKDKSTKSNEPIKGNNGKGKNQEKKAQSLKKKIEEQKKLLEEDKHKAEQKDLINALLEGDVSFDWEEDESELMQKLQM